MLHINRNRFKLSARDEGKIKSYESCMDIRAWSHDTENQVGYLRDWIKCEMPICMIPVSTVARSLRMMSWRRRGKVTPKCHPDCKANIVLDSICNSCHAIKECFREDVNFQKYFDEEEIETTLWPCEKCVEALKSIKMFWKIISDKIFKVKFPKNSESKSTHYGIESVKTLARIWEEQIVEQAIFVKNLTPFIKEQLSTNSLLTRWEHKSNDLSRNFTKNDISTNTDFIICNTDITTKSSTSLCKMSKCATVRNETVEVGCGTCLLDEDNGNIYNLDYLQQKYNLQNDELRKLKTENISLKLELRNMRKNFVPTYTPILHSDDVLVAPKPYESCFEANDTDTVKDIESEMIITMKNCKNKNFRHISMLQVLHKTNDSITKGPLPGNLRKKSEDPIEVLTKVHDTFGAIVQRELGLANKKKMNSKNINIDAYHKLNVDKYAQSFAAKSSNSTISDSIFMSATHVI